MEHKGLTDKSNTNLRGYIFNLNSVFLPEVQQGDILQLIRGRCNMSGPNVVTAYLKSELIGPADSNLSKVLSPILDQGIKVSAKVIEVKDLNIMIGVQVHQPPDRRADHNSQPVTSSSSPSKLVEEYDSKGADILTGEQKEILDYEVSGTEIVKINAFAGTGKTTTLLEYTKTHGHLRFLYVAFNKSVQLEAKKKFPSNVECRTPHSLAYSSFGFKHKSRIINTLRINVVANALNLRDYQEAAEIKTSLSQFLISLDDSIALKHLPRNRSYNYQNVQYFLKQVVKLWRMMRDETDKDVGILHDGYLKLYQLSQPKLDYDVILLDEAQDTNPVVADIIFSQDCPKILVGDRHQQIYTFRGARNAMENIRSSRTFYLTNSFRFGEDIALIANKVLKIFKNEKHQLKGVKLAGHSSAPRDCAIIARTNAGLFDEAVRLLADYKIAFLGGIDGYQFNKILDAYHLYCGKRDNIRSKYIRGFGGYSALLDFAQEADDWELKSICRIVEKYKDGIPSLINGIKNSSVEKEKADVILTTAHKSKGSQFHNVRLIGDFPDLFKDGEIISKDKLKPDEFNLIYVAVTRAKETLDLSLYQDLGQFIMMELTTEDDPVPSSEKNHSPKEKRPEIDNTPGGPAAGPNIGSRHPEHVGSKPSENYNEADIWEDADWAEFLGCDKDELDHYFDSQM